ncbi:barstar family protein [Streptomyces sp. NPDC097595]|uniref:barstar family protein n=1 Tax=Streptomyces sp. NPDC097595 TaxID=3366090 RepID=UPI00381A41D1
MRVEINGAEMRSQADLHRVLAGALDFGPYYGANLAALWDRLTVDVERPVEIIWRHASASRALMGEEQFIKVRDLLEAVAEQDLVYEWAERLTITFE